MNQKQSYYFQKGGGNMPNRFYNPESMPFKPCECKNCPKKENQQGGGALPLRYFNPEADAFSCMNTCKQTGGCAGGCGLPGAVYYGEFRRHEGMHAYNSCNMTDGAASYNQSGGNPIQAPLYFLTDGQPLAYNFNMTDNFSGSPVFDKVGRNAFW